MWSLQWILACKELSTQSFWSKSSHLEGQEFLRGKLRSFQNYYPPVCCPSTLFQVRNIVRPINQSSVICLGCQCRDVKDERVRAETAVVWDEIFRHTGFGLICGHGVDRTIIADVLKGVQASVLHFWLCLIAVQFLASRSGTHCALETLLTKQRSREGETLANSR